MWMVSCVIREGQGCRSAGEHDQGKGSFWAVESVGHDEQQRIVDYRCWRQAIGTGVQHRSTVVPPPKTGLDRQALRFCRREHCRSTLDRVLCKQGVDGSSPFVSTIGPVGRDMVRSQLDPELPLTDRRRSRALRSTPIPPATRSASAHCPSKLEPCQPANEPSLGRRG